MRPRSIVAGSVLLAGLLVLAVQCPSPFEFQVGSIVKVVNTGGKGLKIRETPAGEVIALVPDHWAFQTAAATPEPATLEGVNHLWWYVSDAKYEAFPSRGWVAEGYLTQATSSSLSPRAVPSYFSRAEAQISSVIEKAIQEVEEESEWYDYQEGEYLCLGFVRAVYNGQPLGWISAHAAMNALQTQGLFHHAASGWNPPKGALVFFTSTSEYDHVGLCVGSRQVAHVEGDRKAHIRELAYIVNLSYIHSYAGWSYPSEEWLGEVSIPAIAFFSDRNGNAEIYTMDSAGANQTRLTFNTADDWDPEWSPDGTKIVFQSWRDGNAEIYVMHSDGTNQTNMTRHPAEDAHPSWSPDGTKIVFCSDRHSLGGAHDLYSMDADGSDCVRLDQTEQHEWYPAWSPDGIIVYSFSPADGVWDIMMCDPNTLSGGWCPAGPGGAGGHQPAWSPDSRRLALWKDPSVSGLGGRHIFVINADGTGATVVTSGDGEDNCDPSWSPGSRILFASNQDGDFEICVVNPDGSNEQQLTHNSDDDFHPAWNPQATH